MGLEQLPSAAGLACGGQSAVANHVVGTEVDGFAEDGESIQTAGGQHLADLTYSRRKTKEFTLELGNGADPESYLAGGSVDATFVAGGTPAAWKIRSVQRINTRGPIQLALDLISLTEDITAPA